MKRNLDYKTGKLWYLCHTIITPYPVSPMKYAFFATLLCLGLVACKSDPTAPNEPPIAAPTSIVVQNLDTTSIEVFWSRATADSKTDTIVIRTSSGTLVTAQAANKPDSSAIVLGLQPNIPYTISVHSANNASPSVAWTIPGAATNLAVYNVDSSRIVVAWHRPVADIKTDTIVIALQGVTLKTQAINAPDTAALVTGLSPGIAYTISVHSANAISSSVSWTIPIPQKPVFSTPGLGSTYFFRQWSIDSVGNRTSFDTLRYTVVAARIAYGGKTHVAQFRMNDYSDPLFVNYEPNGDIEIFERSGTLGGSWATIPLGSKGRVSTIVEDSIENGAHILVTDTYTFEGTEDVAVGNSIFRNAIKMGNKYSRLVDGTEDNPRPETTIWFVADLGWFVKASTPAYFGYGQMQPGFEDDLESYNLR